MLVTGTTYTIISAVIIILLAIVFFILYKLFDKLNYSKIAFIFLLLLFATPGCGLLYLSSSVANENIYLINGCNSYQYRCLIGSMNFEFVNNKFQKISSTETMCLINNTSDTLVLEDVGYSINPFGDYEPKKIYIAPYSIYKSGIINYIFTTPPSSVSISSVSVGMGDFDIKKSWLHCIE